MDVTPILEDLNDAQREAVTAPAAPLLVIQGRNDPRVVVGESDRLVDELRSQGKDIEYLVFDDEGHGFLKKENRLGGYGKILDFLDLHLKGGPADQDVEAVEAG